jgi:hypothetical protein
MTEDPKNQNWRYVQDWREAAAGLSARDDQQQRDLERHERQIEAISGAAGKIDVLSERVKNLMEDVHQFREEAAQRFDRRAQLHVQTWQLVLAGAGVLVAASGGIVTFIRAVSGH